VAAGWPAHQSAELRQLLGGRFIAWWFPAPLRSPSGFASAALKVFHRPTLPLHVSALLHGAVTLVCRRQRRCCRCNARIAKNNAEIAVRNFCRSAPLCLDHCCWSMTPCSPTSAAPDQGDVVDGLHDHAGSGAYAIARVLRITGMHCTKSTLP
jgi:hypothetical protein